VNRQQYLDRKQRLAEIENEMKVASDRLSASLKGIEPGVHNPEFCDAYGAYAALFHEREGMYVFKVAGEERE